MLTPQDIQEKEFSKAVFGGYDMGAVDDFLEEIAESYTAVYKENVTLKAKLKVLVEKVEEYRSTEDAMRMALLTAQKMSDDMTEETRKKCDAMLREAASAAERNKADMSREITDEQTRLESAKARTASFVSASRQIVEQYTQFLDRLGEVTQDYGGAPAEAPAENGPVRSPEPESPGKTEIVMSKLAPRPGVKNAPEETADASPEEELSQEAPAEDLSAQTRRFDAETVRKVRENARARRAPDEDDDYDDFDEDEEDEEPEPPRKKGKFSNLQFGSNYTED